MDKLEKILETGDNCVEQGKPSFHHFYVDSHLCLASEVICESLNQVEFKQKTDKKIKSINCKYLGNSWIRLNKKTIYYCLCKYYDK
jgi:hypothetical protein